MLIKFKNLETNGAELFAEFRELISQAGLDNTVDGIKRQIGTKTSESQRKTLNKMIKRFNQVNKDKKRDGDWKKRRGNNGNNTAQQHRAFFSPFYVADDGVELLCEPVDDAYGRVEPQAYPGVTEIVHELEIEDKIFRETQEKQLNTVDQDTQEFGTTLAQKETDISTILWTREWRELYLRKFSNMRYAEFRNYLVATIQPPKPISTGIPLAILTIGFLFVGTILWTVGTTIPSNMGNILRYLGY